MLYSTAANANRSFTLREFPLFSLLDLDLVTFIYESDAYPLEMYWINDNELRVSVFSKVIVLHLAFLH